MPENPSAFVALSSMMINKQRRSLPIRSHDSETHSQVMFAERVKRGDVSRKLADSPRPTSGPPASCFALFPIPFHYIHEAIVIYIQQANAVVLSATVANRMSSKEVLVQPLQRFPK